MPPIHFRSLQFSMPTTQHQTISFIIDETNNAQL